MALPQKPLTEDAAREMVEAWRKSLYGAPIVSLWDLISEPTPHKVHYESGKVLYVKPANFFFGLPCRTKSPSDCTWIVPGTLERKI